MQDMIDMMNISESVVTDFPPVTAETQNERADEIASLWTAHQNAKNTARVTNDELRAIRVKLGERLYEMKQMLSKPGRGGQWSSWLQEKGIPRASADRLAQRHERSLNPTPNCISEADSEPTEEEVMRCFSSLWPKLQRTLRTKQSLDLFIHLLKSHYECGEITDRGILVLAPAAPIPCPVSSDGSPSEPEVSAALVASTGEQQG